MSTGYLEYIKLVQELGLSEKIVPCSPVLGLVRDGRVVDIDPRRVVSAILTPALSWWAKVKLGLGLFRIRKTLQSFDSATLINSADLDDTAESAYQFGRRIFGKEVADYIIDPLMRLTAGSGSAQCSRLGALGGLANGSAQLVNLTGSLSDLPVALAKDLNVIYDIDVQNLRESDQGGVETIYQDRQGQSHTLRTDVGIVATTYDIAERIYPTLATRAAGYGGQLEFVPLISISLAYGAVTRSQAYAVMIPTVENPDILLMFLEQNKVPDRVPHGSSLITLYTDPLAAPRLFKESDQTLELWARQEVERLLPELSGHFRFATVSSWPVSGYLAAPGFWRRTRDLKKALPVTAPVQLAGDVFGAGSMESAVKWGVRAAQNLIDRHQNSIFLDRVDEGQEISGSENL